MTKTLGEFRLMEAVWTPARRQVRSTATIELQEYVDYGPCRFIRDQILPTRLGLNGGTLLELIR